jgi:hypothetical protein
MMAFVVGIFFYLFISLLQDCCDGSDEFISKQCPDNCQELAEKVRREKESDSLKALVVRKYSDQRTYFFQKGLEKRKELIEEAKREIEAKKVKIGILEDELNILKGERDQLRGLKKASIYLKF